MEFAVLGPLEVRDHGDLVDVGPRMPRALLASLLIEANRVVSQDRLIDHLWGDDPPAQATAALQVYVSNLRRALERDRGTGTRPRMLLTRAPGYVLEVPAEALDATRFEALVAEGQSHVTGGNPAAAREVFRRALGLWRGEPYADLAAEPFVAPEAARLSELRAGAVEGLMDAELATGGHVSVVAELERLVTEEPLRERRWELLALALYRCGRQAEALRAIAKARSTLAEELGLDPGASLRKLENDILQQAPSLDWTPPVEDIGQVAWEPLPGPTGSIPPLLTRGGQFSFVGRVKELERLEGDWQEVVGGQRRAILVGGEVGVGKTRLAAELARRLHPEGALVLAGRCDEDMGVPFQPFVEALRHFVAEDPEPARRLGRYAGELTRLVPELVERVPQLPEPLRSDPETERYRLFDALAAWLAAASSDQPVMLVLDDLHWAARPTLLVLRHIVRSPLPMRLLVLGTYRDTEVGTVLPEFLADLRRDPEVQRLSLAGLDAPEVQAFVEAAGYTVSGQDPALSQAIWAETDGNPFFVGEMLRYLAESGALSKQDGRWVSTMALEDLGIPEGVKEVLGRRLSRLSEAANRALRIAAVAGVEFELAVLEAVASFDEEALLSALDEGLVARLLFEFPGPTPRYRFAHALVRGILYDQVAVGRRVGLHRRVGEAIEALHGHDIDDHLPALAHHFAAGGDMAKAVAFAARAGERALAHLAYDEAVAYYGQALEVLEVADLSEGEACHLDLLIALGEAQRRAGDAGHRETLLHAARLAQARGDAGGLSRAALANRRGFIFSAVGTGDADRVAVLEAAIRAMGTADSPTRARLLATLGLELVYGGDRERRLQLSDEALALARRLGDPATVADVLLNRYYTVGGPDTRDERLANATELVALAEHLGDPVMTAQALFLRLFAAVEGGEVREAQRALEACEHFAGELGQPTLRWFATFWRGAMALLAGRLEEAERLFTAAFELGQASGQPDAVPFFVAQQYWVRFEQGRLGEVEAVLTELVHRLPSFMIPKTRLALLYCEIDRRAEARVLFDELVSDGLARLPRDWSWLVVMGACATVCAYLGDEAQAAVLYQVLAPYEGRFPTPAAVAYRTVSHQLGLLATTLGRFDEAESHFSTAAALHERIGAPAWLARTRLEWARLLATRGRTGDAERAEELLGQARATARELGLGVVERRAAALLG